ncbi:MAG: hypothetical protein IT210_17770 [Armatimonadetes bacterium]|nr:hypothetical protein [Armatimonadota bacterium]
MNISEAFPQVGSPAVFYPPLCHIAGGLAPGVLLCHLLFWEGKQRHPDRWIYKTTRELTAATALTECEQNTARRKLRERGLVEESLHGLPRRLHFRVNLAVLQAAWAQAAAQEGAYGPERGEETPAPGPQEEKAETGDRETPLPDSAKCPNRTGQNPPAGEAEKPEPADAKTLCQRPENRPAVQENTTENISRETTEIPATGSPPAEMEATAPSEPVVQAMINILVKAGVSRARARELACAHPESRIRQQAGWLAYRKAHDPPGALVKAIEEEWSMPAACRKRLAAREAEMRAEAEAAAEAARREAADAQVRRQDRFWEGLPAEEQTAVRAEAEARCRASSPLLAERMAHGRVGNIGGLMIEAMRRRIIAERMEAADTS